jgi:hypothetical protein
VIWFLRGRVRLTRLDDPHDVSDASEHPMY